MRDLLLATVPLVTVELLTFYLKKSKNIKSCARKRNRKAPEPFSRFIGVCKFVHDNFEKFLTLDVFILAFYWLFYVIYTVIAGNQSFSHVICPIIVLLNFITLFLRLIYSLFCQNTDEDCYNKSGH